MPTKVKKPKSKKRATDCFGRPLPAKPELRVQITHHRFDTKNIHGYWLVSVQQHPIKYITLELEKPKPGKFIGSTHGPKMLAQFPYADQAVSVAKAFVAAVLLPDPDTYTIVWEGPC